jgi:hypothetical protein
MEIPHAAAGLLFRIVNHVVVDLDLGVVVIM